ncbi:MAG TPA: DUF3243 domain-containing protein [Bacillota bacterium]|nr:DUF3243 domain-containing protein [Peptococcaceae bacterium MAG4]NLW38600.1 DUF3243 domain-containing protein [Peptococcaceae bacterium]HPU36018.1 DUF3243 domain-containing protein [Bacillota bacterium]HPZ42781.1 DUF3243 domain-containing protein [Bacillota bacterium]HQD75342.1 DUF3243 domain-containing protein [Bacillota bacterium]
MFNLANSNWESWKKTLGQAVEFAEELGISRSQISSIAQQVGDLLAQNVPPANPEQKAVKELWEVANQEERQVLANLMTRLATRH